MTTSRKTKKKKKKKIGTTCKTAPVPRGPDRETDADRQRKIDTADDRREQVRRWCITYNQETVAVRFGATRTHYKLPPGPPPYPPLDQCYDPVRGQYMWPHKYRDHGKA